jgi:hypothetical protein
MYKLLEKSENKFLLLLIAGLASIVSYSLQSKEPLAVMGAAIIIAGAALVSGGLLGFLFGIPRTLQSRQNGGDISDSHKSSNLNDQPSIHEEFDIKPSTIGYEANTNLEQISDWLTKILVGVGLIQISSITTNLEVLAIKLKPTLGNTESSPSFAIALIIYFSVLGFIVGYLWTRLTLIGQLRRSEQQILVKRIETLENSDQQDAEAVASTMIQLDELHEPEVSQRTLDKVIGEASAYTKVAIFHQARRARADGWNEGNRALVRRTIRIFRALANTAPKQFHRNYGQLGFALKDQESPDWMESESALTKAIKIRGSWQERGWTTYEFNRAICRIHLYGSDENKQKSIIEDLAIAVQSHTLTLEILNQPCNSVLKDWIESHKGYDYLKGHEV